MQGMRKGGTLGMHSWEKLFHWLSWWVIRLQRVSLQGCDVGIYRVWAQGEENITQIINPNNLKEQPGQTKAVEQLWMVPARFLRDQINKKEHCVVFLQAQLCRVRITCSLRLHNPVRNTDPVPAFQLFKIHLVLFASFPAERNTGFSWQAQRGPIYFSLVPN